MNATKLTLTMDKELIGRAKAHAAEQNISLSSFVANYFRAATASQTQGKKFDKSKLSPITRQAIGLLASPELQNKSYKELLGEALEEKYGL